MLELLTKSSIRRKIILLFVYNRDKELFLSEVARRVKTTPGTARREMTRLVHTGLLTSQKRGNLSLYRINPAFGLMKEIVAIIRKTCGIEIELARALGKVEGISLAFIFGSYARGEMRADSDIDLFIVGTPREEEVYRAVRSVEESVGREINYHLAGEAEFATKAAHSSFIKTILGKPLMILGTKDALRKILG